MVNQISSWPVLGTSNEGLGSLCIYADSLESLLLAGRKYGCKESSSSPNYFAIGVQFRSFSSISTEQVALNRHGHHRTASKESGQISEFLLSGVNQDSFPEMMSGFAESLIV